MAKIPETVANTPLNQLLDTYLGKPALGKVGRTYGLTDPTFLFQVRTDQISCFDIVLPALVQDKGAILTAMNIFWLTQSPLRDYKHHLVAYGSGIDPYLPQALRGNPELQKRGLVISKLKMLPIECVVRGYLTGSGWKDYRATGEVCGHVLPKGLHDGSRLSEPIFTPATKAQTGHDKNIPAFRVMMDYGRGWERRSLEIYQLAAAFAFSRGVIIADTKFEFGIDGTWGDEQLTPDSSRLWDEQQWREANAKGKSPKSWDKQYVRGYLDSLPTPFTEPKTDEPLKFSQLDPENEEHVNWAHSLIIPAAVLAETTSRYRTIFGRLTEMPLGDFQRGVMKIAA